MPDPALIDASSAILLAKAGLIELCCQGFDLRMTHSVFGEVTVDGRGGAAQLERLSRMHPGITVIDDPHGPAPPPIARDLQRLDRGETDTLHHFFQGAARFVILDDGKGVQVCRRHGLAHINALLCPKLLYWGGWIDDEESCRRYHAQIAALGRYTPTVLAWAQQCRPADLAFFLESAGEALQ